MAQVEINELLSSLTYKLSKDAFPFGMRVVNRRKEIVWELTLEEPGEIQIPALKAVHGEVGVQTKLAYHKEWSEITWPGD